MSIIKDDLEHLLTVIDDVIFKLENWYEGKRKEVNP
jgi:hypothetical protein